MADRMNLQSTLEPKLAQLWDLAQKDYNTALDTSYTSPHDKGHEMGLMQTELAGVFDTIRSYYTLDLYDLDALAYQINAKDDKWEDAQTSGSSSSYNYIVRAVAEINDVAKLVHSEQWQGPAALAFHNAFLLPFTEPTPPNSYAVGRVHAARAVDVAAAALAFAQAVEGVKERLVWIVDYALHYVGGGPEPKVDAANLIGFVSGTLQLLTAAVAPEVVLFDIALNFLGVVLGLKSLSNYDTRPSDGWLTDRIDVIGGERGDWKFSGGYRVVNDLVSNLDYLKRESLPELDDTLSGIIGKGLLNGAIYVGATIKPQDLSGAYDATTVKNKGGSDSIDPVVANYVRLYYAGYVSLPNAATYYDAGQRVCADTNINALSTLFPRSVQNFTEAIGAFGDLLRGFSNHFYEYGQSMVQAAQNYKNVDEEEAAAISKYEYAIPSHDAATGSDYYTYTPPDWLKE